MNINKLNKIAEQLKANGISVGVITPTTDDLDASITCGDYDLQVISNTTFCLYNKTQGMFYIDMSLEKAISIIQTK